MPRAAISLIALVFIGVLWLDGRVTRAQDGQPRTSDSKQAALELKADPRLKVPLTANFKKPKVRNLLDALEKATGLQYSANEMVETTEEGFGSLSFRNTPAWIVMQEVAKSPAVKGRWEKTADGYTLVGTLDAKAQETRVAALKKDAGIVVQTPEPPAESSGQFWIFVVIMALPAAAFAGFVVVRRWRGRTATSNKTT